MMNGKMLLAQKGEKVEQFFLDNQDAFVTYLNEELFPGLRAQRCRSAALRLLLKLPRSARGTGCRTEVRTQQPTWL